MSRSAGDPPCPRDEQAVAFALHALEPDEELTMRTHIEGCRSCRATVRETEPVLGALAGSTEQVDPPPRLRHNILAVAADTPQAPPAPDPHPVPEPEPWAGTTPRRRRLLVAAAAALVIGLGGLTAHTARLQQERDALAEQARALAGAVTRLDQPGTVRATLSTGAGQPSPPCSRARPGAPC
ncbi:hypothetical protein BJF78_08135 [Pseudonocardia sp. CNS-139]|nr:hypothetical protein BJF78_08135 [Pseudonocardia sp. CNS-139]